MGLAATPGGRRGFTLIELATVIVILGVVSAVAIPVYLDYTRVANRSACRGALGAMRAAVANYYAWSATPAGGSLAVYPSLAALSTADTVLEGGVPANPFDRDGTPNNVVDAGGQAKGTVIGLTGGWCYDEATGQVWANTSTKGSFENTY